MRMFDGFGMDDLKKAIRLIPHAITSLIFLAGLYLGIFSNTSWQTPFKAPSYIFTKYESGSVAIGEHMFTTYVVPFEVLSLVLLAAFVGAIYIAIKGWRRENS